MNDFENEYRDMVKDLAKPGDAIIDTLTSQKCHLWHMASALMGEVAELTDATFQTSIEANKNHDITDIIFGERPKIDVTWIKEEVGDCLFYFEGILIGCNWAASYLDPYANFPTEDKSILFWRVAREGMFGPRLVFFSAEIFDVIKKNVLYNKPLDHDRLRLCMNEFLRALRDTMNHFQFTREGAKRANMAKLLKGDNARYASGTYSDEQAQQRADKN